MRHKSVAKSDKRKLKDQAQLSQTIYIESNCKNEDLMYENSCKL